MMGPVREWLLGVACTAMVLALAQILAPEGSVKKVVGLAGGLALLLAAVSPLLRLEEGAVSRIMEDYRAAVDLQEAALAARADEFYQAVIAEQAAAYIVDKAAGLGISCRAEVTLAYDEDGMPCPWAVTAWGTWTQEGQELLCRLLEEELGVPPERQHYHEETTP